MMVFDKFKPVKMELWIKKIFHSFQKDPLKILLWVAIIALTLIKLDLIGVGFRAMIDEFRYGRSGIALLNLSELKWLDAIDSVFSTHGRPADALIKTIPNAFQFVTAKLFNLEFYESKNSYPLFLFNFCIYCSILFFHYKLSKLLLKSSLLALFSVLIYSALTNSHLYLRHALPYDTSLLIFIIVIYETIKQVEKDSLTSHKAILLGFFAFFAFLVYPGYFPLYITIVFLLFFFNLSRENISKKLFNSILFGLGSLVCLAIFEALSRVGGGSYIMDAITLSSTITQGSFEESFSFLFKYLWEVERLTGILLIVGLLFLGVHLAIWLFKKERVSNVIFLLAFPLVIVFLVYASAGYFLHKMVFYGRLLHQYFPFLALFTVYFIFSFLKNEKDKKTLIIVLSVLLFIDFGFKFSNYKTFGYPRDVFWGLTKEYHIEKMQIICELEPFWPVVSEGELSFVNNFSEIYSTKSPEIILVNGCFMYDVSDVSSYNKFVPDDKYQLIFSKPHFINFKAYQFEGSTITARKNLDSSPFFIQIYQKK